MLRPFRTLTRAGAPALVALALTGSMSLVTVSASAAPPQAPAPQPPAPQPPASPAAPPLAPGAPADLSGPAVPGADALAKGQLPAGLGIEKPSLLKELPITAYCLTAVSAALGAALYVFGGNAKNELAIPADHTTPSATHSLVVRARVGQVMSDVFFPVTGLAAAWGTVSTILAVRKVSKFITVPTVGLSAAPLPGGMAIGMEGRF
jgi:hypothetical protein